MWEVHLATWSTKVIESVPQIPQKPMTRTNDLCTRECLEASHRACSSFQMLMVTLNPLLLHLAFDVLDLR